MIIRGSKEARREAMFALIEKWKGCGQSRKEFCKEQSLALSVFHYWLKKWQDAQSQPYVEGFIPLKVHADKSERDGALEIYYPNGVKIVLRSKTDISMVRALVGLY
ncbi:MAG: hypothetical protein Q8862_12120 [Bacteroidota bacterium]|nr:hypothetical protein [Bacteroidota bacterium]MDP4188010.1 hypothetical protein [Bacteroidota bacterium]